MPDGADDRAVPHCLVISDGRRGIENQALGLAEACAALRPLTIQTFHVPLKGWKTALPAGLQSRLTTYNLLHCDMAIACGRRAIPALMQLKRTHPGVFTVCVQDPRMEPSRFDLVIAPEHDPVRGSNVITMIGSPNRVTPEKLEEAVRMFSKDLSDFPGPRTVFLIGGNSRTHKLTYSDHMFHVEQAQNLLEAGHSILITLSRRTPDFAKSGWRAFANGQDRVWLHESGEPNPYFAFLGAADRILVTEDSTNMLTEACTTGTPVFRLPMTGEPGKFVKLYGSLEARCGATRYSGQQTSGHYDPLKETERVAGLVWNEFDKR